MYDQPIVLSIYIFCVLFLEKMSKIFHGMRNLLLFQFLMDTIFGWFCANITIEALFRGYLSYISSIKNGICLVLPRHSGYDFCRWIMNLPIESRLNSLLNTSLTVIFSTKIERRKLKRRGREIFDYFLICI